jgi:hypothetical protein
MFSKWLTQRAGAGEIKWLSDGVRKEELGNTKTRGLVLI